MKSNGSPSYGFWTLHLVFQRLRRSIIGMRHLKSREDDDGSHGGRKVRVSGVVDCAAGGKYFSINFGWPLRGGGGRVRTLTAKCR